MSDNTESQPTRAAADQLHAALASVIDAITQLNGVADRFSREYELQIPPATAALCDNGIAELALDLEQLDEAAAIVLEQRPVAALSPRGYRWREPQTPTTSYSKHASPALATMTT